jgi:uncharacterized protein (TIGR02246 family)
LSALLMRCVVGLIEAASPSMTEEASMPLRFATVVTMILFTLAPAMAQTNAGEAAIRADMAAMERAWNARDGAALAALYAPDGDLVMPNGPRNVGREAVRQAFMEMLSRTPPNNRIGISVTSIRFPQPGVAIAETAATFTVGQPSRDRATSVWVLRDSTWQIAAFRVMPAEAQ